LSRPDFRELTPAPFTDPILDAETLGNPNLQVSKIDNFDLRWEYYFYQGGSFSLGSFYKKFAQPIEKLRLPGSGVLLGLANALSAKNYGVEADFYRSLEPLGEWSITKNWANTDIWRQLFLTANVAWIKSSIELDPVQAAFQTNLSRPMQGQSPYVVNLQLNYIPESNNSEWGLLFNRFGKRLSQVGVQGQPDIYEQPVNQLDAVYKYKFAPQWNFSVRLKNLLNEQTTFTQADKITREFKAGREIGLSVEWAPK
jgi:outer membrane receptor protein involved in Fe transport